MTKKKIERERKKKLFTRSEQIRHGYKIISSIFARNKNERKVLSKEEMDRMLSYLVSSKPTKEPTTMLRKFTRK